MSLLPANLQTIPAETRRVAQAAFPKGNLYVRLRDEFGPLYEDEAFADLFPSRGRPAESPGRLALITVFQFAEGLSDRAAAAAVQSRVGDLHLPSGVSVSYGFLVLSIRDTDGRVFRFSMSPRRAA